jgi:hypothetical protein
MPGRRGGKRAGAGRKPGSISPVKRAWKERAEAFLERPGKTPGLGLVEETWFHLLSPVVGRPPKVPVCGTCGRSDFDHLVNDATMSRTLFEIAEHAHGRPRQAVEVSNPDGSLSPEGRLQSLARLMDALGLQIVKKRG